MADRVEFKRNIGLFLAVMIGIGAMMGPGIFALPGELAGTVGPLGILAYLAMVLLTVLTALNYSELGAAIPIAGGGYSFTSRTLPRPLAFFTGWFFWIGNTLACSMYAMIFSLTIRAYFWPEASIVLLSVLGQGGDDGSSKKQSEQGVDDGAAGPVRGSVLGGPCGNRANLDLPEALRVIPCHSRCFPFSGRRD